MKTYALLTIAILCWLSVACVSCSDIVPLWVGEQAIEDYKLFATDFPREFEMKFSHPAEEVDCKLELELTYYIGIGRKTIPLYIVIQDKEYNIREYAPVVVIKEGKKWLGEQQDNEIDYSITHPTIERLKLRPGEYTLKIYANDDNYADNNDLKVIDGVVKITARLFEIDPED